MLQVVLDDIRAIGYESLGTDPHFYFPPLER